jgi:hypothetical protein
MSWLGIPDPNPTLLGAQPGPVTHVIQPGQNMPALGPGQHARLATGTHTQFTGDTWTLNGTEAQPCFVSADPGAVIDCNSSDSQVKPRGSWFILHGLKGWRTRFAFGDDGGTNASDYAVRDYEGWGLDEDGNGTILNIRASKRAVILRPHIHDNGTPSANEPGCNGITASGVDGSGVAADGVWILDGEFYRNRGDHVRFGRPTGEVPRNLYVSGCLMWEDRTRPDNAIGENAIDIKLSQDVVVSGCTIFGFRSTPTSPGEGIVVHDNCSWVWLLRNDVAECQQGLATTSGTNVYYLGNFIRDMTARGFRLTPQVTVSHNTIRRCPVGMDRSGSGGVIVSNLMHECAQPFVGGSGGTVSHNITSGDPLFTGANIPDVQAGSPVKDAGTVGPGYAAFQARYGFSVEPAWNGTPDVGCYEVVTGGAPTPITDLLVEVAS